MAEAEESPLPTQDTSRGVIEAIVNSAPNLEEAIDAIATLHFAQAFVIRGTRNNMALMQDRLDEAERELKKRELHHFETEQIIERIKAARSNHPECKVHPGEDEDMCGWKSVVLDIDKALEKA